MYDLSNRKRKSHEKRRVERTRGKKRKEKELKTSDERVEESRERETGEGEGEKRRRKHGEGRMTKLNYKSYELAALEPSPPTVLPLFRHSISTHPTAIGVASLPFSLHFYYDEPSSSLSRAFFALYILFITPLSSLSLLQLALFLLP